MNLLVAKSGHGGEGKLLAAVKEDYGQLSLSLSCPVVLCDQQGKPRLRWSVGKEGVQVEKLDEH